ncbi:MAG: VWA domain-containing protein [Planctomycetes bacterium]|nr:VWA domain-containing protein [Planctomycetota bacterium]
MPLVCDRPQLLLLLLLLPLVWQHLTPRRFGLATVLRLVMAAILLAFPAGIRWRTTPPGRDLIVLVDRSASCAGPADAAWRELRGLTVAAMTGDDRLAVIGFGRGAVLEQSFDRTGQTSSRTGDREDESDIAAGLALADAIRDSSRRTGVLLLSDGKRTGPDPLALPRFGAVPIWYRLVGAGPGPDVAAGEIGLPERVAPGAAWPVALGITANREVTATYRLRRNGAVAASGSVRVRPGENRFTYRDSDADGGFVRYVFEIEAPGDTVRENNRSAAILPVGSNPKVLLVRNDGRPGLVADSLRGGGMDVEVRSPEAFPTAPAELAGYGLVVLEDTRAVDMPLAGARALAASVRNGLTSLLVTGGRNSFGSGGYHRSVLDPLLPVELELRSVTRRGAMAVAFALDRSGSMAVPAGDGLSKMDLANIGAAESIRLLQDVDQAALIAVDSSAHPVIPLSIVDDAEALAQVALKVQSMGGGIYCRTALEAAAREVEKSDLANRHIILFADADDAEEQEGCLDLAAGFRRRGIGLSVVAMGDATSADAEFLRQLAIAGGGEALFSADARGLPALFTGEVMRVSRRGFLEERVEPELRPGWHGLGLPSESFPTVDGYNIAAARDGAVVSLGLDDEFATPLLAVRRFGRTAAGAVLFQLDGEFAGRFPRWSAAPGFIVALARNLLPDRDNNEAKAWTRTAGDGGAVDVEFSPELARTVRHNADSLTATWLGPGGMEITAPVEWTTPERVRANLGPVGAGSYVPVLTLPDGAILTGPPATASYSPEFRLAPAASGALELERLALHSGGGEMIDVGSVLAGTRPETVGERDIGRWLLVVVLVLFLVEVALRRGFW